MPAARRVLLISPRLDLRGTSLYTVNLAIGLKRAGHLPHVISDGGYFVAELLENAIPHTPFDLSGSFANDLFRVRELMAIIQQLDPQVLHFQTEHLAPIASVVARLLKRPYFLTAHSLQQRRLWLSSPHLSRLITISQETREALVNDARVPRSLISVVPNGVDISPIPSAEETPAGTKVTPPPIVGALTRLERVKGVSFFLEAARLILDRPNVPHPFFFVAGEGPDDHRLRRQIRDRQLSERVTISLPAIDHRRLLTRFDVFVLPSLSEGLGIFMLEAMALEKPVVAAGSGGVFSIIEDGANGLLVPKGNAEGIADKTIELLENEDQRHRLGRAAREFVREHYPLEAMVRQTLDVYGIPQLVEA